MTSITFDAIGTSWQIDVADPLTITKQAILTSAIKERIDAYDHAYSRFRDDSLVTAMSITSGVYTMPEDSRELFEHYRALYDLTNGKVTPLIGNVLVGAGYDKNYSLTPTALVPAPHWDDTFLYRDNTITMHIPALIDIGAGGKGHLIDIVGSLLIAHDIYRFCIDAGGDILEHNLENAPMRIGLENPFDMSEVIGVAHLHNQSIAGSAGTRRTWREFHHIMDPDTCTSPHEIKAVWVIAPYALLADILTTALFFVPPEILTPRFDFDFAFIRADGTLAHSPTFPAEFYTQ